MSSCIKRISKEVLGESKGKGPEAKETWWWNEEVQAKFKAKKEYFKKWQMDKKEENLERYKYANRDVKKVVRESKQQAYDNFYAKLETKDGEKCIYKLAKIGERKTRDFNQVKCVKNEDAKVLMKDDEIKERWKGYFNKLLNEKNT